MRSHNWRRGSAERVNDARGRHEALLANFIGTGLDALFVAAKRPLKSNEEEQKDAWENVYRKFVADGKEIAGSVAQTRVAQSERVIKTIDLATDAVIVLINGASVSMDS